MEAILKENINLKIEGYKDGKVKLGLTQTLGTTDKFDFVAGQNVVGIGSCVATDAGEIRDLLRSDQISNSDEANYFLNGIGVPTRK